MDLGSRKIVYGRPLVGTSYVNCGALKYFAKLGLESFIKDLPRDCYPDYVYEFYANLITVNTGVYASSVRGRKIMFTPSVLDSILNIVTPSSVSIITKKGPIELDGFGALDQLKILHGMSELVEYIPPTAAMVTPIAHVLFKLCIENINPRTGSRSNFAGQDVSVIAMLLAEKSFNLSELILKNMLDVFYPHTTPSLPYGLFLTRVFQSYGVELKDDDKEVAKAFWISRVCNNLI